MSATSDYNDWPCKTIGLWPLIKFIIEIFNCSYTDDGTSSIASRLNRILPRQAAARRSLRGYRNFRNEIVWERYKLHNDLKRYGNNSDSPPHCVNGKYHLEREHHCGEKTEEQMILEVRKANRRQNSSAHWAAFPYNAKRRWQGWYRCKVLYCCRCTTLAQRWPPTDNEEYWSESMRSCNCWRGGESWMASVLTFSAWPKKHPLSLHLSHEVRRWIIAKFSLQKMPKTFFIWTKFNDAL